MKERPILFSGEMVRAILEGWKTQTRRPVKNHMGRPDEASYCPYGAPGDRLWVRETSRHFGNKFFREKWFALVGYSDGTSAEVCFEHERPPVKSWWNRMDTSKRPWTPSIHMPRSACRLVLEVTGVRVERLQAISEADLEAENYSSIPDGPIPEGPTGEDGKEIYPGWPARDQFQESWNARYATRGLGWDANPWVWVIEFKRTL